MASLELQSLLSLLQDFQFEDGLDERFLNQGVPLSTKHSYNLLMTKEHQDHTADNIWTSRVPNKVKVFAWLLFRSRLNTRANLHHKHILNTSICTRCLGVDETSAHLFIRCPFALRIWQRLRLPIEVIDDLPNIWDLPSPMPLHHKVCNSVILTIMWKIWDASNAMVFHQVDQHSSSALKKIIDDFTIWSHRFRKMSHKVDANSVRIYLSSHIHVSM